MDDQARPTLAAVAALAGVSVSTASLVFSGAGPVAAATREKVRAAAAELDYAGPDPTARSLRRGRSGVVAVITEDRLAEAFRDPMNLALLDGIGEGLGDERMSLLVVPLAGADGDLISAPMDAAILLGCGVDIASIVEPLRRRRIPIVGIETAPLPSLISVDLDNRSASRRGAEHLHELGHRRVSVVTLPLDPGRLRGPVEPERLAASQAYGMVERLAGVREVFPDAPARSASASSIPEGLAAGRALLAVDASERPTAIVAQSDLLAIGVLRAAEEAGIAVPEQLSVLGFDGIRADGATVHVLTTLVQPAVRKGRLAAEAVLAALAGDEPPREELHSDLRIGTTTGPALAAS